MTNKLNDTHSVTRGSIQPYSFDVPFWEATKERRLLLQYCPSTKQYQYFPRPVSIFTGRRDIEWRPSNGKGSLYSFTISNIGPGPFRDAAPYAIALVELDEGVRVLGNLVGCSRDDIKIGMRLRLHWHPLPDGRHLPMFERDPTA
ncbi:Zn-ribbon domain-containing OB-fold protein [Pseudorhodoplanes sp.]|uniref:Zn-ribbon domain-containing OB-fold protein n=1 Tax=Pseudorhodoplanes sp. TaxID=1934341 RepID=UPI003D0AE319